jgi:hypothetical protein
MSYTIYPLKGVNQIEFGMPVQRVRDLIGNDFLTGDVRAKSKDYPTDYILEDKVFFYYDETGHLEAVEFAAGASILLGGINPLSINWGQAREIMLKLDPDAVIDDEGAESRKLSLAIWCPDADEGDDASVESFLVGRPGYYD